MCTVLGCVLCAHVHVAVTGRVPTRTYQPLFLKKVPFLFSAHYVDMTRCVYEQPLNKLTSLLDQEGDKVKPNLIWYYLTLPYVTQIS